MTLYGELLPALTRLKEEMQMTAQDSISGTTLSKKGLLSMAQMLMWHVISSIDTKKTLLSCV